VEKAGVIRYIQELKEQGVVRHIGLSSHVYADFPVMENLRK
jgi:predicted aldo/keto reductase-like oxidoreductase